MQERPTKTNLLQAISRFLLGEIHPTVADKRLSFRILIAANLANVVAAEIEAEQAQTEAQISRLAELMPDASAGVESARSELGRRELLSRLNRELTSRIREQRFSDAERERVWRHVKETLMETLAVDNPRFDTSAEIE